MPKSFFGKIFLKHPYDAAANPLPAYLTKEENEAPILNNAEQAQAIYKKFDSLLANKDNPPKKVGITYSANHEQTKALNNFYQKPTDDNWNAVKKQFKGSVNQGDVIHHLIDLLDKPENLSKRTTFVIIPISTMGIAGKAATEPNNEWIEKNLKDIHQFVKDNGYVLGWRNQFTAKGELAIGGGVASHLFGDDQNKYVQAYFQALEIASRENKEPPEPPSFKTFEKNLKGKEKEKPSTSPLLDKAAEIADDLSKISSGLVDSSKSEKTEDEDIELDVFSPRSPEEDSSEDKKSEIGLDDGNEDNDEFSDEDVILNDEDLGISKDKKPEELNKHKDEPVRDKSTIRNVKNRLEDYVELIKYFESQILIAHEQMDPSRLERATKACLNLQEQLLAYQKHLTKESSAPPSVSDRLNKTLDTDAYQYRLLEKKIIDKYLQKLEEIMSIEPHAPKRVRKFSDESEVAKTKDDIAILLEKYLSGNVPSSSSPAKPVGGLVSEASPTLDKNKSTEVFSNTARVNLIKLNNQGHEVRFVSVQQTENNSYKSTFHVNGPLDTSRQYHLGYTLPNNDLLKIAVAEVQNWRAGNPDLSRKMHIVGNMPKELVEAIVLYCEHKGFSYSNDTVHKIDLSSAQQKGYNNLLKAHPDKFLVNKDNENRAILIGTEKINKLAAKTKVDVEPPKATH